ncbi:MAG TPA: hypothetical protein VGT61_06840 [Thermomicrobiales bacterium]|jgi:hypothetical protein|nr:hypothetical protein [Thermomicrobiales bacterium]
MTMTVLGASTYTFAPDLTVVAGAPIASAGAGSPSVLGAGIGVWAITGDRTAHATVVHTVTDQDGTYSGTLTVHTHLEVSADGQTLTDGSPETTLTYRDTTHAVTEVVTPFRYGSSLMAPATGVRMTITSLGFPVGGSGPSPSNPPCRFPICPIP